MPQILTRAKTGSITYSTYESYETTARLVILPRCGGVRLDRLTVGRCDRILQKILDKESISKARHARAVLSLVCGYAVRDDAMVSNPVRDVQRLPTTPKKESTLTTEQLNNIRELMQQWRVTQGDGPRPNYRLLIDGMEIMLGTSIRIGECLGLRRCDVDMTTLPPTLVVNGTIVSTKAEGIHRKDSPKRSRQRRSIALPSMAAAAVRRRLALAEPDPEASLFATKSGRSLSVSNYERFVRSLPTSAQTWSNWESMSTSTPRTSTDAPRQRSSSGPPVSRWHLDCSAMQTSRPLETATLSRPTSSTP